MMWCSLESVFTGGDIAKQMPMEAKKFAKIDKDWVSECVGRMSCYGSIGGFLHVKAVCCFQKLLSSSPEDNNIERRPRKLSSSG